MQFTPHWQTEQVNSISRKCEIVMNWQLFGLTQDQSPEIIIAYYFVNETAHKQQTAWIPWINLGESWGMPAVAAVDTHTSSISYTHTSPPIFRASHGMSSSAIQLRISVLQLNSAISEQNERPKPSGERKALTTLIYKVLLGKLCPCNHLPSVKEVCVCVYMCVGLRGEEGVIVHTLHLFVDRYFFCTEPGWPKTHNNIWITGGPYIFYFSENIYEGICDICSA